MNNNKYKVLIVEDEANICSFIETLLTTNDYQALVAHTCTMGLTLFASHNPDLVILDLGLPDRDGLELIRTVRINSSPSWSGRPRSRITRSGLCEANRVSPMAQVWATSA